MLIKFKDNEDLSRNLAKYILKKIKKKKNFVIGCPSGRSLKKTYKHIGILSHKMKISLNEVKIIMMDEYLVKDKKNKLKLCNPNSHFSCVGYSYKYIQKFLNYKKTDKNKLLKSNIYFPKIKKPNEYDSFIKKIGGVDIFLLASGSSDGHVAFNNVNTKINSTTHIIRLAQKTRLDNLKTFPKFQSIKKVPKFGITVGLGTIYKLSKEAILVLSGKEKNHAAKIILDSKIYNKNWPSSIIYKCKKKLIYIDKKALNFK